MAVETLNQHILKAQRNHPQAHGVFSLLLQHIAFASKVISREVTKAGLVQILGKTGTINVQGEEVMKLDDYANDVFIRALSQTGLCAILGSEELADPIPIPEKYPAGDYVCIFDPLDGSSNIDANVSIGTIFSIFRKVSDEERGTLTDCLQPGINQVAAGYIIYGSATMFVYTTGAGVHGFTLDPSIGEFCLSHHNIKIPEKGKIYSTNEGNTKHWKEHTSKYIKYVKSTHKEHGMPYTSRYIGSLVADFHRNLLYGGIFLYPEDNKDPKRPTGKLRLMCECNPMAFICEQAGGKATTGTGRILEIEPTELQQRVPIIIGSKWDVELYEKFTRGEDVPD